MGDVKEILERHEHEGTIRGTEIDTYQCYRDRGDLLAHITALEQERDEALRVCGAIDKRRETALGNAERLAVKCATLKQERDGWMEDCIQADNRCALVGRFLIENRLYDDYLTFKTVTALDTAQERKEDGDESLKIR